MKPCKVMSLRGFVILGNRESGVGNRESGVGKKFIQHYALRLGH
ncbi:hypothetical protein [Moorena sp. SIOASIH]|nr:hypothetical protein [Moorena sp. SIOASIH]